MNQSIAEDISEAILNWRDGDSVLLIEEPFEDADIAKPIKTNCIGVRITFAVKKRKQKLTSKVQEILKTLETFAFEKEINIDYLEIVRIKAEDKEVCAVEVVELKQGRGWLPNE
jgi:hypothetical protein